MAKTRQVTVRAQSNMNDGASFLFCKLHEHGASKGVLVGKLARSVEREGGVLRSYRLYHHPLPSPGTLTGELGVCSLT